jgi:hypothetical protein
MPKPIDEGMKELRNFYPDRAYHLSEYLRKANAEMNVLEAWREAQLVKFIASLILNADELITGFTQKRIAKLAWAARNLLELSIWVEYCNSSPSHAKQFRDDSARDLIGLSKAIQSIHVGAYGIPAEDLDSTMKKLVVFAESAFNVTDLDEDFKRVSDAAAELGRKSIFSSLNKLFSKFAHPTALSLNSVTAEGIEADNDLREMFFLDGADAAILPLVNIRSFVLQHFPLP